MRQAVQKSAPAMLVSPLNMPELRKLLESLELSQRGLARLMGRNERRVREWIAEEPPPDVVPVLKATAEIQNHTGETAPKILERLYSDTDNLDVTSLGSRFLKR